MGFPVGDQHRLSVFNHTCKYYVLMGTVAEIKTMSRSLDIENFLELDQDLRLDMLVREPVKY